MVRPLERREGPRVLQGCLRPDPGASVLPPVGNALRHYRIASEFLHADTTSVYFEGEYADEDGQPKQEGGERIPMLVEGYNKDGQRNKVQLVLSLITSGRVPLWYRPWDGNQTDDPVYLADMTALRETLLATSNTILIGDRKLCNEETMVTFCRQKQLFIGAHPLTATAKGVWLDTWQQLPYNGCVVPSSAVAGGRGISRNHVGLLAGETAHVSWLAEIKSLTSLRTMSGGRSTSFEDYRIVHLLHGETARL